MNARDFERFLVERGAPASFLDIVTRKLRQEGKLRIGGRGRHAAEVEHIEAAWIMIGLAATDVAAQAVDGFRRQMELEVPRGVRPRHYTHIVEALQIILGNPQWASKVAEIRVGRTYAHTQIVYHDAPTDHFVLPGTPKDEAAEVGNRAFRSEGVLSGGLIHEAALALAGRS